MKQHYLARYAGVPAIVMGFHGCDKSVADDVINEGKHLDSSNNDYDWLGPGIYFWESNPLRALEWAKEHHGKEGTPAVIGAFIDLGNCLNLLDSAGLKELQESYLRLKKLYDMALIPGAKLPKNVQSSQSKEEFSFVRRLDCAVINFVHKIREKNDIPAYDTVRGVFWEGKDLYETAGFKERNHIQISVVNPRAILGYFRPMCF